jgi:hypothetical protein
MPRLDKISFMLSEFILHSPSTGRPSRLRMENPALHKSAIIGCRHSIVERTSDVTEIFLNDHRCLYCDAIGAKTRQTNSHVRTIDCVTRPPPLPFLTSGADCELRKLNSGVAQIALRALQQRGAFMSPSSDDSNAVSKIARINILRILELTVEKTPLCQFAFSPRHSLYFDAAVAASGARSYRRKCVVG